jgi:diguanylate cyclase (GGDEF)-like protein
MRLAWALSTSVRSWAIWRQRPALISYLLAVAALYAVATAAAWAYAPVRTRDLAVFAALIGVGAVSIEAGRRIHEPQGTLVRDLFSVWCLPIAILLPPAYALSAVIPLHLFRMWRTHPGTPYRGVFTLAAAGLALGGGSLLFHAITSNVTGIHLTIGIGALTWVTVVIAGGVARWAINVAALTVAIKLSEPSAPLRQIACSPEVLYLDLVELTVAVMVTTLTALNPVLMVVAIPSATLLRRGILYRQLDSQARIDAKTGLLNATSWRREAITEIARAARTRSPLAVVIADVDNFKQINDTAGHLAGDQVLTAIATVFKTSLREYDLAGRFGGDEFTLLLPGTSEAEALRITERLRTQIAELGVPDPGDPAGINRLPVTVSIGTAVFTNPQRDLAEMSDPRHGLVDLFAAADNALYQAKKSGRNRVCLITDASRP